MSSGREGIPDQSGYEPSKTDFEIVLRRLAELEEQADTEELGAEAQHRKLLIDEIRQRMNLRRAVLFFSVLVVLGMFGVIAHSVHTIMWKHFLTVPRAYAIALIVGPVISITTVTVALLIGAFRRFKETDADKIDLPTLAAEVARSSNGG